MALIKCNECGKDISDKSKICNGCGAPIGLGNKKANSKGSVYSKKIVKLITILFIVLVSLVVVVKTFFFAPIVISNYSMSPLLNEGDVKIISKISKINRFDVVFFLNMKINL